MPSVALLEKPGGGERGTGRDLPLRAPLIPFPGRDPGDLIYNENGPFLLLLNCFSAIAMVALAVLQGPGDIWALFLEGPQGPPTSGIISTALFYSPVYRLKLVMSIVNQKFGLPRKYQYQIGIWYFCPRFLGIYLVFYGCLQYDLLKTLLNIGIFSAE